MIKNYLITLVLHLITLTSILSIGFILNFKITHTIIGIIVYLICYIVRLEIRQNKISNNLIKLEVLHDCAMKRIFSKENAKLLLTNHGRRVDQNETT